MTKMLYSLTSFYIFVPKIHASDGLSIILIFWIKGIPIGFEQHKRDFIRIKTKIGFCDLI